MWKWMAWFIASVHVSFAVSLRVSGIPWREWKLPSKH